jgi:hypothetical protein
MSRQAPPPVHNTNVLMAIAAQTLAVQHAPNHSTLYQIFHMPTPQEAMLETHNALVDLDWRRLTRFE